MLDGGGRLLLQTKKVVLNPDNGEPLKDRERKELETSQGSALAHSSRGRDCSICETVLTPPPAFFPRGLLPVKGGENVRATGTFIAARFKMCCPPVQCVYCGDCADDTIEQLADRWTCVLTA